jgi:hypothetical protein
MFTISIEWIAFLGILFGAIGRTVFPFLKKLDPNDTTPIKFNARFWMTAVVSGVIAAIFVYPTFVLPATNSILVIFISGFTTAWAADDILNRLATADNPAPKTTSTTTVTVNTPPK